MITTGTLEGLASTVGNALAALQTQFDRNQIASHFASLGTRFPDGLGSDGSVGPAFDAAANAAGAVGTAVAALTTAQQNGDVAGTIAAGVQIVVEIEALASALDQVQAQLVAKPWPPLTAAEVTAFANGLWRRVFDDAIVSQFERERPHYTYALTLLGVIDRPSMLVVGAHPDTPPVVVRSLRLERLGDALTKPGDYLKSLVGWGESPFDPTRFLLRVEQFLSLFSFNTEIDTTGAVPTLTATGFTLTGNSTVSPPGVDFTLDMPIAGGLNVAQQIVPGFSTTVTATGAVASGTTLTVAPPSTITSTAPVTAKIQALLRRTAVSPEAAVVLLGQTGATRLQVDGIQVGAGIQLTAGTSGSNGDVFVSIDFVNGKAVIDFSQSDGFLKTITSGTKSEAAFQLGAAWSVSGGLRFTGSAGITLRVPVHISLGAIQFTGVFIGIGVKNGGFSLELSTEILGSLGPFTVDVDRIGIEGQLSFPTSPARGNLGPANLGLSFKPPTGIGMKVDAGSVTGGGFLSFDKAAGRYAGAVELSVYSIAVKAFGVVETKFPDGSSGFSFVVVISAEFTPIQLSFGFTLIGVGGLVGINRSLNSEGLSNGVRSGALEHLLFPQNLVKDAPQIISDLSTVFPASKGHYVFGPMAKLGWGTPTLISAELGIILEVPGPRLALIGVVQMALPTSDTALISLHIAVAGILDFPKRLVAIDARLYDSHVAGFALSGDTAFRLSWGSHPNFAMAIGGFNPAYLPPPGFPTLKRIAVDAGINGNPRLTIQGYFALTSNTAQAGASLDLHAHGFGIDLDGHLGFDALFVFSPFSFQADFSAGVRVSFHGVGFGIGLHGSISGPSPFHVDARACVSVLWWDACLPVSITFGKRKRVDLPPINPWVGSAAAQVVGLQHAVEDSNNWSGGLPNGAHAVVTLTQQASGQKPPIDPVGEAKLLQKVCPLNLKLSRFGVYKPTGNTVFTLGNVLVRDTASPTPAHVTVQTDQFAPALFKDMGGAERLSSQSYQSFDAGFTINPDNVVTGDIPLHLVTYDTDVVDNQNNVMTSVRDFSLTLRHLLAMLERCASARGGIRQSGVDRFFDPTVPILVVLGSERFVVANACSLQQATAITPAPVPQTTAQIALDIYLLIQPADRGVYQVVPSYLAAA